MQRALHGCRRSLALTAPIVQYCWCVLVQLVAKLTGMRFRTRPELHLYLAPRWYVEEVYAYLVGMLVRLHDEVFPKPKTNQLYQTSHLVTSLSIDRTFLVLRVVRPTCEAIIVYVTWQRFLVIAPIAILFFAVLLLCGRATQA